MNFTSMQFRVGALVLVVCGLIAYMSMRVSEDPASMGRAKRAWFLIPDASGLVKNSAVKMAGITVGIIRDIKLEDGLAHVDMSLRNDIPLTTTAKVEIRANGILGDKHVELLAGNPSDPPLRNGGQIISVEDRGSMDALVNEVGKITKSLGSVAESLKSATTGDGDTSQPLGRIVRNIENLTHDLAELSHDKKQKLGEIIDNVHEISETLNDYINDDSDEGFKAALKNATASLSHIDHTLHNVQDITDKINNGQGTIGKLVNDDTTVEQINTAVEGVNDFLDQARKLETSVDFHSYLMSSPNAAKSTVSLRLQPGPDRYYEVGVVDDPRGLVETTDTTDTGTAGTVQQTETKTYYYKVKFNALFAKNFYDFTVRAGMIESTGGLGFDYKFFRQKLIASLDFFQFSDLNVRATARYNLYKGVYLMGGAEDLFRPELATFLGGGIFLTNDDLKMLFAKVPF